MASFGRTAWRLLAAHVALVAWIGFRISPTCDEVGHLPAGLYCWEFGRFDVYRVNPPLVRALAALPVACSRPKLNWKQDNLCGCWIFSRNCLQCVGGRVIIIRVLAFSLVFLYHATLPGERGSRMAQPLDAGVGSL
ncbi:MAG TPA: hypothetical protein VMV10_27005 [Pirellulales bacterium]|nr:hypothetical protein [Pirellulales bacterium]